MRRSARSGFQRCLRPVPMLSIAAIGVAFLVRSAQPQPSPEGTALDLCAFRPIFLEDFNSLSVSGDPEDRQRWFAHTPWGGDFGDAAFADPEPAFPFSLRDGILRIEARKGADDKWRSGLLASAYADGTGFAQRYGYFEACQVAGGSGAGLASGSTPISRAPTKTRRRDRRARILRAIS